MHTVLLIPRQNMAYETRDEYRSLAASLAGILGSCRVSYTFHESTPAQIMESVEQVDGIFVFEGCDKEPKTLSAILLAQRTGKPVFKSVEEVKKITVELATA